MYTSLQPSLSMFSRSLIRSTLRLQVRQASTASAEQQAKQGAQQVAGGAKEGAQAAAEKVQAAAGPYLEKAQKLAGSVGATVGNSLGGESWLGWSLQIGRERYTRLQRSRLGLTGRARRIRASVG